MRSGNVAALLAGVATLWRHCGLADRRTPDMTGASGRRRTRTGQQLVHTGKGLRDDPRLLNCYQHAPAAPAAVPLAGAR